MGKQKYLKRIEELFKKSPVISYNSIEKIVKDKKNVKQYTKKLIRNLITHKDIKKITKGYYTIYNDTSVSVYCFKPSYLGLQDSLSFHNLWEQETISVILTTKKVRQGIRKVMGNNVLVKRIEKKYMFGFDYFKNEDLYIPYSDVEKTFIDMVYFKENISKEAIKNIRKRINRKKLGLYLKVYPKKIREKTLTILNKS